MVKHVLLLFLSGIYISSFSQAGDNSRIPNQFIVMLQPAQMVELLVKEFQGLQIKKCLSKQMNIWLMQRNTTDGAEQFLYTLRNDKAVKLAQFNHHVQSRALVPDDPFFTDQWNMLNTGQDGGLIGADIDATHAWAINHRNTTANGDTVVVAIIDGSQYAGFDITHEDLNFFVNYNEIPNNGIDDDGNGFIDDYYGWNAFDTTGNIQPGGSSDTHAMLVTGVAGAIGNNGKGVAGVCWGANILRVVGASGEESQVVEAYDYVREMRRFYNATNGQKGAFVVSSNSSFGIDYGEPADYPIWCAMYDSMGAVGILSAAATNNTTGLNINAVGDMPTACPSKFLITVTNTTDQDKLNAAYGDTTIAIGAPGTGIYSTEPGNGYGSDNGTSFASPHIAGTVAAMYAAACPQLLGDYKLYPDSVALIVKQMILSGATRLSALYNLTITGGRLNLYNAIQNLSEYNCNNCNFSVSVTATQPACSNTCNGLLQLNVQGQGSYSYNWSTGDTGVAALSNLCPGNYSVTVTNRSTNCSQVKNVQLYKPDSIAISSIHIIPATQGDSGNIIVSASAGNYVLSYSLNGVNYQQASTLVVSNNGTYNVYIKNGIGCVVERTVNVTGVNNLTQTMEWNVFPNPVSNKLNISFNLSQNANMEFAITNMLGQKVLKGTQTIPAGLNTIQQDVSSIASGAYFIALSNGNATSVQKFIIAR